MVENYFSLCTSILKLSGKASSYIYLASEKFDSEFYDDKNNIQQIILEWINSKDNKLNNTEYLLIHPNPSADIVSLSYQLFDDAYVRIDIVDMAGRIIQQIPSVYKKYEHSRHIVPIHDLANGSYVVRLYENDELRFHQGLIVIN